MKDINRWTLSKLNEVEASLLSDLAEITGKLIELRLSRKAILEDECRYTKGAEHGLGHSQGLTRDDDLCNDVDVGRLVRDGGPWPRRVK